MGAFPTVAEELERKVVDSLVTLHSAHERGEVTERELFVAIRTLSEAVSGLVPRDVMALLSMDEVKGESTNEPKAKWGPRGTQRWGGSDGAPCIAYAHGTW
jgi:hypothetical protein